MALSSLTGFHLEVIYRLPGPHYQFLEEFGEFLAALSTCTHKSPNYLECQYSLI